MTKHKPPKRTSGPTIPDAERENRDQFKLQLRVRGRTIEQLDELCAATASGGDPKTALGKSDFVAALIDSEHRRMLRRRK